jgi:hypothetical protein
MSVDPSWSTAIPIEYRELFTLLSTEVTWLHAKWQIFKQLFAHSDERIAFLNEMAPAFFIVAEDALRDDILLSFARLTDPRQLGKYSNLSLHSLLESMVSFSPEALVLVSEGLLAELDAVCAPIRDIRNRRIGHLDLPTALNAHPTLLPGVSQEMVERALALMRQLLNGIQGHYDKAETAYLDTWLRGDGNDIVFYLEQFEKQRLAEEERLARTNMES